MKLARLFGFLAAIFLASHAAAQPNPLVRPLPNGAASTEVLGALLRDLAFEPKALSPDVFQVTVEREHWPVHIMTSLSTDGKRIWLESKFAPVDEPDHVPPLAWKRLLEANEKIGPAHFTFDQHDRRIHLYKSFDNQGLTSQRLKQEIESFDLTVRKTQDYWRGENFKPVLPLAESAKTSLPELPAPKTADVVPVGRELENGERLLGDWRIIEIAVKGRKTPDGVLNARKASLTFRNARDGDIGPSGKSRITAELRTGPDSTRTVRVDLNTLVLSGVAGKPIDFVDEKEKTEQGIYKLEGDTLTLCFAAPGELRPTAFTSTEAKNWVIVLKKR